MKKQLILLLSVLITFIPAVHSRNNTLRNAGIATGLTGAAIGLSGLGLRLYAQNQLKKRGKSAKKNAKVRVTTTVGDTLLMVGALAAAVGATITVVGSLGDAGGCDGRSDSNTLIPSIHGHGKPSARLASTKLWGHDWHATLQQQGGNALAKHKAMGT